MRAIGLLTAVVSLLGSILLFAADDAKPGATSSTNVFPVTIRVDAARTKGELRPIWRFFGADEPNYAYKPNGRKLLAEIGQLRPQSVYFRTHNLLNSGDGKPALKWGSTGVYAEDAQLGPVYDWTIVDLIFETYLERGIKPYVEIGFMPKELSVKPVPYQHQWTPAAKQDELYTGWAYPPNDYPKWADVVYNWIRHCIERFGTAEVERWYWEVWNEPNIGYWHGTPKEFYDLHDYAIAAVRSALPTAKVGGPETAGHGGQWMRDFIEHCLRGTNSVTKKIGTPLDFVSFHAKGAPTFVNGHVRMGIANQLRTINDGFELIASYPELKNKPIVIGESVPDECGACPGPQFAYRNGTLPASYTAASFARLHDLVEKHGVNLEGAVTWAFEFEEQPFFAGFRALASNGVDLPVLNVFRMFARMSGQRLAVESDAAVPLDTMLKEGVRARPYVSALASLDQDKLCILAWHYHDDDVPGPAADIELVLAGLPLPAGGVNFQHFRIDDNHSNAFSVWQYMGSPQPPTPEQYAQLVKAGQLAALGSPETVRIENGKATLRFNLPRQAVSLLVFELATPTK